MLFFIELQRRPVFRNAGGKTSLFKLELELHRSGYLIARHHSAAYSALIRTSTPSDLFCAVAMPRRATNNIGPVGSSFVRIL